jgi:transcriptional regulator with XRE-family HTH domain
MSSCRQSFGYNRISDFDFLGFRKSPGMVHSANTLGRFIADLMQKQKHNNSSLAQLAGVSESAVRNLLKVGIDPRAKDPDAHTLRKVADALGVDPLKVFRLAGYIPSGAEIISVRAEYLGVLFDQLAPEKQDAILSLYEALSTTSPAKGSIQSMRQASSDALAGIDLALPGMLRLTANQLIVDYNMTEPQDVSRIEPNAAALNTVWEKVPDDTRERIKALIQHKLSLSYDPTMVDENWRR